MQLTSKISPKLRPTTREDRSEHREGGTFTRRAAAEIAIGYEYFRVPVLRLVQDQIRTRLSCFVEAQIIRKRLAVIMSGRRGLRM